MARLFCRDCSGARASNPIAPVKERYMRVLYCVDSFGLGGKERQAIELLKGIKRRSGIEISVVCMDRESFYEAELQALGMPVCYVTRSVRWDPLVFVAIRRLIKQFRPAVIHTNGLVSSFYVLPLAKWLRIPVVNGSIRNAFSRRDNRWRLERTLLSLSDIRVANSLAGLQSRGLSAASGRDYVVYNGMDLERVRAYETKPRLSSRSVVGMVAEFNSNKDYATFISAALRLLRVRSDVEFVTVGDGETHTATLRLVPAACNDIKFLGRRKDIEGIVSTFSIGVLTTFGEGISNSIMEYMAFGKPVVATDAGGCREIVINGQTGVLVPPRDPIALADTIAHLLDRPELASRMGRAGLKRIESHFSLETMTDATVRLYEQAIEQGTRDVVPSDSGARYQSSGRPQSRLTEPRDTAMIAPQQE